ncbi:MAG: DUF1573 domain-containing protein [Pirellulaceae bacterium]|nr:DUF1573 domain-containing protein [Pirellulaceae bacterium]
MLRNVGLAILLGAIAASAVDAKEWAQKMFTTTSHDFGNVARGSKSEFVFEIQNPYEEDVHIVDVKTSCGCTTPTITRPTLKTWEKGAIIATLNTKAFVGPRTSTLTVVIDKPFYAEVQLSIAGNIHSDIDFQPGSVLFGEVQQGAPAEQEIAITHRGRTDWQIVDVRSVNTHLEVELSDARRVAGGVMYKMLVRLKEDAPAGAIFDTLNLVTNDDRLPSVSLPVEGRVVPPLAISPSTLFFGMMQPGQTVTKQMVVTGKQPFRITAIRCDDPAFQFRATDTVKKVHLIPVTFTAGDEGRELREVIEIETDLPSGGVASCLARGTIGAGPTDSTASALGQSQR